MRENIPNERNSVEYSNISSNEGLQQRSYPKSKFCLCYILIWLGIFILFAVNFFVTINAFQENRILVLKPEVLCRGMINELNICLGKKKNKTSYNDVIDECSFQSSSVEECYDGVARINRKCYIYLSELDKCVRDNILPSNTTDKTVQVNALAGKCSNYVDEIKHCSNDMLQIDFGLLYNSGEFNENK